MTARDDILQRIRAGLDKDDFTARLARAEAYMAAKTRGPQALIGWGLRAAIAASPKPAP